MPSPIASLAGIPLGGAAVYEWPLVAGVKPHQARFVVDENTWKQLETYAGIGKDSPGLTYKVTRDGVDVHSPVNGLFILDVEPGPTSHTYLMRVVDRRWLWGTVPVATTYNATWTVGENVIVSEGQNPETPDLVPTVQYKKPTLQGESKVWTADEVLKDVVRQVTGQVPVMQGNFNGLPVDDLAIDLPGDAAIELALSYFPGAAIFLDYDGNAVVKDVLDGSEVEVFERLSPFVDEVRARMVDRKFVRPRRIDVLFTPEIDVRFDYEEAPTGTITNSDDTNRLYNVGVVTEAAGTTIDGVTYGPGSWLKLEDLFGAWGAGVGKRLSGGSARELSFDILRKHRTSANRYLNREFIYIGGGGTTDPQWQRRMAQAWNSYRRTFRVAREFMQRLDLIRPVRASVIAPNTGARASSPVYSDYTVRPSHKGFSPTSAPDSPSGVATRGYAARLENATPAPVRIRPIDLGAGIFLLEPNPTDTQGFYDAVWLGYPTGSGSGDNPNPVDRLPSQSLGGPGVTGLLAAKTFALGWDHIDLEADWKFSTVMSCIPNSPNNASRLYKVTINAGDVGESEALGPPMTVRVYPGVVTARFSWNDDEATQIIGKIRGESDTFPSQLVNRRHVEDVARASALRVYERFKNRPAGTMNVDSRLAPDQLPVGLIDRVTQAMAGGATRTQVSFGTVRAPQDIWRYLPASTQRALLRSQLTLADPMAASFGF